MDTKGMSKEVYLEAVSQRFRFDDLTEILPAAEWIWEEVIIPTREEASNIAKLIPVLEDNTLDRVFDIIVNSFIREFLIFNPTNAVYKSGNGVWSQLYIEKFISKLREKL